jgi:hypothetical protein
VRYCIEAGVQISATVQHEGGVRKITKSYYKLFHVRLSVRKESAPAGRVLVTLDIGGFSNVCREVQFIDLQLFALKCEHNGHTVSYMFRPFLSAIIRESLYQLTFCPSN